MTNEPREASWSAPALWRFGPNEWPDAWWPSARTGAKGQRPTQGRAGAGLASPAGILVFQEHPIIIHRMTTNTNVDDRLAEVVTAFCNLCCRAYNTWRM